MDPRAPLRFDRQIALPLWLTVALAGYTLAVAPFTSRGDGWALIPPFALLAAAATAHIRLILTRQPRWQFGAYAVVHLLGFAWLMLYCLLWLNTGT
jgi:hypothetical protein